MNERIKQLAKQAGEYVNSVYTPPVRSKTPGKIWEDGHIGWHTQFNEKFAELIVRECVDKIVSKGTDWVDFAPSQTGVRPEYWDMAQQIKQHFGVEE